MFRLFFFMSLAMTSALASFAHADDYYSYQRRFVCTDSKRPFHVQVEIGTNPRETRNIVTILERGPDGALVSSIHPSKRVSSPWDPTSFSDPSFNLELLLAPDPTIDNFKAKLQLMEWFEVRWKGTLNCQRIKN